MSEQDEVVLTINEWLDALSIDRAYRKDMRSSYLGDIPALKAQLAKAKKQEREKHRPMLTNIAGYFRHIKAIRKLTFEESDMLQYLEEALK